MFFGNKFYSGLSGFLDLIESGKALTIIPTTEVVMDPMTKFKSLIVQSRVFVFIEGTPILPANKASNDIIRFLEKYKIKYKHYDILSDYAKVYPELTSEQRQYFGELAAGKHQITVFNAIVDEMSKESYFKFSILEDSILKACAGFYLHQTGMTICWALFSEDAGKVMLRATRVAKKALSNFKDQSFSIMIDEGFEKSKRWARMLGFRETQKNFYTDKFGRTFSVWER